MLRQRFGGTPVAGDRLVVVNCQLLILPLARQREVVESTLRCLRAGHHSGGRSEVAVVLTSAVLYLPLTAIT